MLLEKNDLKEIKKIVDTSAETTKKELRIDMKKVVDDSEQRLNKKIDSVKNEITCVIRREVNDLADINRAVINRTEELDYRLRIVERKLGLNAH